MKISKRTISAMIGLFFAALLLWDPDTCKTGATEGLLLCGRVIIPSLFSFTACVLFLVKIGALRIFHFLEPITTRLFHLSADSFSLMLFSLVGGYPTGAKLLSAAVANQQISSKTAGIMLGFSVNAGPAFILLAVGKGVLHSATLGKILLFSHMLSALIIAFLSRFFLPKAKEVLPTNTQKSLPDCFVEAVTEAASALLNICAYVVLFSTITAFVNRPADRFPAMALLSCFLEVTCAVSRTHHIPFISFLLGFSGFSVWFQVFSVAKGVEIRFARFALTRVCHGILSAGITWCLLKILPVPLTAAAQNSIRLSPTYNGVALSLSLLMMTLLFLLTLFPENRSKKTDLKRKWKTKTLFP